MRLLRVHIIAAETCGGLLDGLDIWLRSPWADSTTFDPLCLVGPNGTGKSQFLQVLAEIFQAVFHACSPAEERVQGSPDLLFEVEYLIRPDDEGPPAHVRIARQPQGRRKPAITVHRKVDDEWTSCALQADSTRKLLPKKVVGYTSGENETLSLPFLVSRSGYADEVGRHALDTAMSKRDIPDTRLMLIDYGTHLEMLVANLLLGTAAQRLELLRDAHLARLHSFRCIVQLAHSAVPKAPTRRASTSKRKGIQLTDELEDYLKHLRNCATCHHYDEKNDAYIFDFWADAQTTAAFRFFWRSTLELYAAFHKLAMLNDLAIPKPTRERFTRDTRTRRFASRLPEPQDEDKVFRFERVGFESLASSDVVDYVSLSDGEHQLAQLLGAFCMVSSPDVLFLLDEPESHLNPTWRVKFISRIRELPSQHGQRKDDAPAAQQDCILTTHSPFVPSDMQREQVFIFFKDGGKLGVRHPDIETYGTTFDAILEECFGIRPPISDVPRADIARLKESTDPDEIKRGLGRLGYSVEKVFLADRLRQLTSKKDA